MYVHGLVYGYPACYIDWRWSETILPFGQSLAVHDGHGTVSHHPTHPRRIAGPEARISCRNSSGYDTAFDFGVVYLRAE